MKKILTLLFAWVFIWTVVVFTLFALSFSCSVKPGQQERAIYDGRDVYWENARGKVYKLTWSDIQVLGIDSVRSYYLEQNTERE